MLDVNNVADYLAFVGHSFAFGNHHFSSPMGECYSLLVVDFTKATFSQRTLVPSPL